jgi:cyclopropane fatty-acyl-phospholipid synthase-like methyltransferase
MFQKIRKHLARKIYQEANFETHFNLPLKFQNGSLVATNERIVELPFVFAHIPQGQPPLHILDFGCARSWLSLSLAAMGHQVLGIDLRDYPFQHPQLTFRQENILKLPSEKFDIVISLSTLEHVGLGAYGATYDPSQLEDVIDKIGALLKSDGMLILTLPVGKPSVDQFERSFAPDEIKHLMQEHALSLACENYYCRTDGLYWKPCPPTRIREVDNDLHARKKIGSGVNGLGCYVFLKKD